MDPIVSRLSGSEDFTSSIEQHKVIQTKIVKWLCIKNIYEKLVRPNFFDIGGTYQIDVPDLWFMMKTEQKRDNIFLLHLFISNFHERSFSIVHSLTSDVTMNNDKEVAMLGSPLKETNFQNVKGNSQNYLTTYVFNDLTVDLLKDKTLYIPVEIGPGKKVGLTKLVEDIKADHHLGFLLDSSFFSDFTIESSEGEIFPVHKAVLRAHSEVFKAMLREDTAESLTNHVQIDASTCDLRLMLEFIYTGTLKNVTNVNWINLLQLADLYNIVDLMELCQHALAQSINAKNVFSTLIYAETFNSHALKIIALNYIQKNAALLYGANV